MARKERSIEVKIIEDKKIYDKLLVDFFAKKYEERYIENNNQKS